MATLRTAIPQKRPAKFQFSLVLTALAIMLASGALSLAQTMTVLHTFNQVQGDGYNPYAPVVVDQTGVLYGTTFYGGNYKECGGCGEVFEVAPTKLSTGEWKYAAIYEFTGGKDGCCVYTALTLDSKGRLYGVTDQASPTDKLFRLTAPAKPGAFWHFEDLYDFTNGLYPNTPLLIDNAGALYGVTAFGGSSGCGSNGCGTVLQFVPTKHGRWTENILYQFTGGADGAYPASIVLDSATGVLYGVAEGGGIMSPNCTYSGGCGTVFSLAPTQAGTWNYSVLYSFTGVHDGGPYALVPGPSGDFYGLSTRGADGEEAFKLTPRRNGTLAHGPVHFFSSKNLPIDYCGYPPSFLTSEPNGIIYGTIFGDIDLYFGAIFQLTPPAGGQGPWSYATLWDFNESGPDLNPNGVALGPDGALYGTTNGGDSSGGTVFRLELPSQAPWPPSDFCY